MADKKKFGELLTKAIRRIALETDCSKEVVYGKIAPQLGKEISTIDYWSRGRGLPRHDDLEVLAWTLFERPEKERGLRDRQEIVDLLKHGGHPSPTDYADTLFPLLTDRQTTPPYKFLKLDTVRQLFQDGSAHTVTSAEVQSLADFPLPSIRHRKWSPAGKINHWIYDLTMIKRNHGHANIRVRTHTDHFILWTLDFNPPLQRGETATYEYRDSAHGTLVMTREECQKQFNNGSGTRHGDFEYWRRDMTVPTDELLMKIEFPPGYPISLGSRGFSVYVDSSEHHEEILRLQNEKCFQHIEDASTRQHTLILKVPHARMGLGYELQWLPPFASDIQTNPDTQ